MWDGKAEVEVEDELRVRMERVKLVLQRAERMEGPRFPEACGGGDVIF